MHLDSGRPLPEAQWVSIDLDGLTSFEQIGQLTEGISNVKAVSTKGDRSTWAYKFFHKGFRVHPLTMRVRPYLERNGSEQMLPLGYEFEKISEPALAKFPMADLLHARSAPDDMLRLNGPAAEGSQAQYDLAARFIEANRTVVDLGCGYGHGGAILRATASMESYLGVDSDAAAITYAETMYGSDRVRFSLQDANESLATQGGKVGAVLALQVLPFIPDPEALVVKVHAALGRGGVFVASLPNRWYRERGVRPDPRHVHSFDMSESAELLRTSFDIEKLYLHSSDAHISGSYRRLMKEHSVGDQLDWNPEFFLFICRKKGEVS